MRRPGASPIDFSRLFGLLGETPCVVEVGSRRLLPDLELPIASGDADAWRRCSEGWQHFECSGLSLVGLTTVDEAQGA